MKNRIFNLLAVTVLTVGLVNPVFAQNESESDTDKTQPTTQEVVDPGPETGESEPPTPTTTTPSDGENGTPTTVVSTSVEQTVETTIELVETTVTTEVSPSQPTPRPSQPHIPIRPQPSNRPQDIEVIETSEVEVDENEEIEEIDLFEGEFITFNANVFTNEEEADQFIDLIGKDEETKDRFEVEKEVIEDDFILVRVTYAEDVEEDGRYILLYVSSEFETEEEAEEYLDHQLLIYPDLFVAGEMIKVGETFDLVFGIRPGSETQAVTYDEETLEIQYEADRKEYTYTVKADELTGEFIDEIQVAVEEAFPGEFIFSQTDISETEREVTMTPLPKEDEEMLEDPTLDLEEVGESSTNE
ncbi:hypothetical protein [Facklamia miroungae]|uniref:Uncharacterized protein n=1 Tax=Facklamia miroungae TaxID=120956 RepID=A0A1G7T0Q0_9LACT|nr:hypothetical protein [Facklamia miroungae]NKZ29460.1 hypothetical protein [Facklamia miroungae]SDG28778.1 hypothetical protein SAMN05421791_104237 [Facklamia miroungae]